MCRKNEEEYLAITALWVGIASLEKSAGSMMSLIVTISGRCCFCSRIVV